MSYAPGSRSCVVGLLPFLSRLRVNVLCVVQDATHTRTTISVEPSVRTLSDFKGDALVQNVLKVVDSAKPLPLVDRSAGDPLVRYRESKFCPAVTQPRYSRPDRNKRISTNPSGLGNHGPHQCCGSLIDRAASRNMISAASLRRTIEFSKSIAGHQITVHCTITAQMLDRPGYLDQFLAFWDKPRRSAQSVV